MLFIKFLLKFFKKVKFVDYNVNYMYYPHSVIFYKFLKFYLRIDILRKTKNINCCYVQLTLKPSIDNDDFIFCKNFYSKLHSINDDKLYELFRITKDVKKTT